MAQRPPPPVYGQQQPGYHPQQPGYHPQQHPYNYPPQSQGYAPQQGYPPQQYYAQQGHQRQQQYPPQQYATQPYQQPPQQYAHQQYPPQQYAHQQYPPQQYAHQQYQQQHHHNQQQQQQQCGPPPPGGSVHAHNAAPPPGAAAPSAGAATAATAATVGGVAVAGHGGTVSSVAPPAGATISSSPEAAKQALTHKTLHGYARQDSSAAKGTVANNVMSTQAGLASGASDLYNNQDIRDGVQEVGDQVVNGVRVAGEYITDGVSAGAGAVGSAARTAYSSTVDAASDLPGVLSEVADGTLDRVNSTASDVLGQSIEGLIENADEHLSELVTRHPHKQAARKATDEFAAFLRAARLEEFMEVLVENGYDDVEVLAAAGKEDLVELGFVRGHAIKLSHALTKEKVRQEKAKDLEGDIDLPPTVPYGSLKAAKACPVQPIPRPPSAAWSAFLSALKAAQFGKNARVYISFCFDTEGREQTGMKELLMNFADDLRSAGAASVYLDSQSMHGDFRVSMRNALEQATVLVPMIGPDYKAKVQFEGGFLRDEWEIVSRVMKKRGSSGEQLRVVPIVIQLQKEGDWLSVVPPFLSGRFMCNDMSNSVDYEFNMSSPSNPLGIIAQLFEIDTNTNEKYQELQRAFLKDKSAPTAKLQLPTRPRAWEEFLKAVGTLQLLSEKRVFISYAWEEGEENIVLQQYLTGLADDLRACGVGKVFLDIESMQGDMINKMESEIRESDLVIFMCTPTFRQRASSDTNVNFELTTALDLVTKGRNLALAPVIINGDFARSVPPRLKTFLIRNAADVANYHSTLAGIANPLGVIPSLLGITRNDAGVYRQFLDDFHNQSGNF